MRLRTGKFSGDGMRTQGELADQRAALFHFREQFLVLLRVDHIDPASQHPDRRSSRRRARSAVRQAVNSAREAAHDHQASFRQVPRQPLGYLIPVRGRTTRAQRWRSHGAAEPACLRAHTATAADRRFPAGAADIRLSPQCSRPQPVRRTSASSFSASRKPARDSTACAVAAGRRQASNSVSDALKTASGEPNCRSSLPVKREPRPRVRCSASQGRETSRSTSRVTLPAH